MPLPILVSPLCLFFRQTTNRGSDLDFSNGTNCLSQPHPNSDMCNHVVPLSAAEKDLSSGGDEGGCKDGMEGVSGVDSVAIVKINKLPS